MAYRFVDFHPANMKGYHSIHRYLFDTADNEFLISYAKNKKFEKPAWMSNEGISDRLHHYSNICGYVKRLVGSEEDNKYLTTFSKGVKHFGKNLILSRKNSQESRREGSQVEDSVGSPASRRRGNKPGIADTVMLMSPTKFRPRK